MLTAAAQTFLQDARLGFISYGIKPDAWSRPVPVWYEWADGQVRVFSGASAPKVERLREYPTAHIVAANHIGEPEAWVSITADVEIGPLDGDWLETLSARYWDLSKAQHRATVDDWLSSLDSMVLLTLRPTRIRTYGLD